MAAHLFICIKSNQRSCRMPRHPGRHLVDPHHHGAAVDVADGIGVAVHRFIVKLAVTVDYGIEFGWGLGIAGLGGHDFSIWFDRKRPSLSSRRALENRGRHLAALFPGEQLRGRANSNAWIRSKVLK